MPRTTRSTSTDELREQFIEACSSGQLDRVRSLVKDNPCLTKQCNSHLKSALELACSQGHLSIISHLVENANCDGIIDQSLLHIAVDSGNIQVWFSVNL